MIIIIIVIKILCSLRTRFTLSILTGSRKFSSIINYFHVELSLVGFLFHFCGSHTKHAKHTTHIMSTLC